jgi:hypothetical protein
MLDLCKQVFEASLGIYTDICSTYLAALTPTLGLGSLLPVKMVGILELSVDEGYEGHPTLGYGAVPLPSGQASFVSISAGALPRWGESNSIFEEVRPAVARYRPEAQGWADTGYTESEFSAYKERPATHMALKWIHEDLKRLNLVKDHFPHDEQ